MCAFTPNQLGRLGISSMVPHNREAQKTDFTVSVDAADGITTGISAFDRASTIEILASPSASPKAWFSRGMFFRCVLALVVFLNGLVTPKLR